MGRIVVRDPGNAVGVEHDHAPRTHRPGKAFEILGPDMAAAEHPDRDHRVIAAGTDYARPAHIALDEVAINPLGPGLVEHTGRCVEAVDAREPARGELDGHEPGAAADIQNRRGVVRAGGRHRFHRDPMSGVAIAIDEVVFVARRPRLVDFVRVVPGGHRGELPDEALERFVPAAAIHGTCPGGPRPGSRGRRWRSGR